MSEDIRRIEQGNVLTIVFNRDSKLNALSDKMIDELRRAAEDLGDRRDLSVMVIRATGRYFTAGLDIGSLATRVGEADGSGSALRRSYRRLHLLFDELESIEKPIVLAAHAPVSASASNSAPPATSESPPTPPHSPYLKWPTWASYRAQAASAD